MPEDLTAFAKQLAAAAIEDLALRWGMRDRKIYLELRLAQCIPNQPPEHAGEQRLLLRE